MTAEFALPLPLRALGVMFGALWALPMSAFVLIACLVAQILSLLTSVLVLAVTFRWEATNILREIALPRIADLWRDVASLGRADDPV